MKIAIICSCADPGRDGVGDYSVRLAAALAADADIRRWSLPSATSPSPARSPERRAGRHLRAEAARRLIERTARTRARGDAGSFSPDWVILQFVCWGLADRGVLDPPRFALLAALSRPASRDLLPRAVARARTRSEPAPSRGGAGASARRSCGSCREASAGAGHDVECGVSRCARAFRLEDADRSALQQHPASSRRRRGVSRAARGARGTAKATHIVMAAVFGSVYPEWQPQAALRWISSEARRRNRRALLVMAGRPIGARRSTGPAARARVGESVTTRDVLGEVTRGRVRPVSGSRHRPAIE